MVSDGFTSSTNNNNNNNLSSLEKSFRIKQDDRFFSRLMSKETSMANTSSRVFYYGETSVTVPFTWEAQPGTPKHPLCETSMPPLTPPPSYFSNNSSSKSLISKQTSSSKHYSNIFSCILPMKFSSGSRIMSPAPLSSPSSRSSSSQSSSSSSWSILVYPSSSSLGSSSMEDSNKGRRLSLSNSSTKSFASVLKQRASHGFIGCYLFRNMKNAIVSHGGV